MGYSIYPPAAAAEVNVNGSWYSIAASATIYQADFTGATGIYRVRAYSSTLTSTPTATVNFINSSGNVFATVTTADIDTGSTANYSEYVVAISSAIAKISISSTLAGWVSFERISSANVPSAIVVNTFSTSQTVTTLAGRAALIGGGGGGAINGNSGASGGSSGYLQLFPVSAGSYALVIGSGGIAGNTSVRDGGNGSASTFNGYTANGGLGGINPGGGTSGAPGVNGGSGSGAGTNSGTAGAGGSNGSNGLNGSNGAVGGTGSGVTMPWWKPAGNGGSAGNGPGGAGGLYGGGGGAGSSTSGTGGTAAANTGGGGGAGANFGDSNTGGAGGSGVLFIGVGL